MTDPYGPLDAAYAAARWGWYLSTFLVLGAGSYAPFLLRSRTGLDATDPELARNLSRRAAAIGWGASLVLLLFTAARLYLQARSLLEPDEAITREALGALFHTNWGRGWTRQAMIAVLAAVSFSAARRGSGLGWMAAAAAGGGLGFTAGMTGHAVTEPAGKTGLWLDTIHVWSGGLWIGGLAVLLWAGLAACRDLPSERRPVVLRALVGDFSRRALLFGPVAIGAGIWMAVRYLGWRWPWQLLESGYGTALAVKLAALAGVALLGAYNWRVVQPALGGADGARRLGRSGALEVAFGVALLLATAVLVALPFPGESM